MNQPQHPHHQGQHPQGQGHHPQGQGHHPQAQHPQAHHPQHGHQPVATPGQVQTPQALGASKGLHEGRPDAIAGSFKDMTRNPGATFGGVGGMLLSSVLLYFGFVVFANAQIDIEKDDDDFEIPFEPGALVKLGSEVEAPEIPEKVVIQETREEEETIQETLTEEDEVKPPEPDPPEPEEKPKKVDKPPPKEKKDKKLPTNPNPTKKNTPFPDKPTNKPPPGKKNKGLPSLQKGDPFGDPGGWADLAKDGDPWATAVMKALNNMPIGTFGAKAKKGDFRFELTLCKDGSIKKVNKKGGSMDADGQNAVRLGLEQLKLPKPPASVAKKMKSKCAKIKYKFRWSASGVK